MNRILMLTAMAVCYSGAAFARSEPVIPLPPNPNLVPAPAGLAVILVAAGAFALLRKKRD